jgi:ABC-type sugar transport system substrate-binding protein
MGILDDIMIAATDGTPAGLEAIDRGDFDYTQALCGVDEHRLIEMLYDYQRSTASTHRNASKRCCSR